MNKEDINLNGIEGEAGSGVEFQKDQTEYSHSSKSKTPKIIRWVVESSGGSIGEKQASFIIIVIAIMVITISLTVIFNSGPDIPKEALENPGYGLPAPE